MQILSADRRRGKIPIDFERVTKSAPENQHCWGEPRGAVDNIARCEHKLSQQAIPVLLLNRRKYSDSPVYITKAALDHTIGLWMVGRSKFQLYAKLKSNGFELSRGKMGAVI